MAVYYGLLSLLSLLSLFPSNSGNAANASCSCNLPCTAVPRLPSHLSLFTSALSAAEVARPVYQSCSKSFPIRQAGKIIGSSSQHPKNSEVKICKDGPIAQQAHDIWNFCTAYPLISHHLVIIHYHHHGKLMVTYGETIVDNPWIIHGNHDSLPTCRSTV